VRAVTTIIDKVVTGSGHGELTRGFVDGRKFSDDSGLHGIINDRIVFELRAVFGALNSLVRGTTNKTRTTRRNTVILVFYSYTAVDSGIRLDAARLLYTPDRPIRSFHS